MPIMRQRWRRRALTVAGAVVLLMPAMAPGAYLPLRPVRHAPPPVDTADLLKAQAHLSFALIVHLARHGSSGANIVVSPAGVAAVLSLLDLGATPRLRSAIHHTLSLPWRPSRVQIADLERVRETSAALTKDGQQGGPIAFANSLTFASHTRPKRDALLRLAAAGADVAVEDLSTQQAVAQINGWVRDRTRGEIPTVLNAPPRGANLVAVNALYFADRWRAAFDPSETKPAPFRFSRRKTMAVQMMHLNSGRYEFKKDRRFIAVTLPYHRSDYAMTIVTTRGRPAGVRAFEPVAGWLSGLGFKFKSGDVAMPRFSLSDSHSLLGALDALGLRRGRLSPGALRGFSSRPMQISRILQRTKIKVDEKGTVAAAATMVMTMRSAVMTREYLRMIVDKPFMFALRNERTGLILLAGYVGKPSEAGIKN